nr:hypothetical protein [Tanacetum cinerariifolium]
MCKTAKEVWHTLIITRQGNSEVNDCKIDLLTQQYEKSRLLEKKYVRKFLRTLPLKWRAKASTIEEAKDLATLPLDELIGNLKVYEMILENDDVASKTSKEKVKSLALIAKFTREKTRDDDVEIDLVMVLIGLEEAAKIDLRTNEVKALDKGEVVTIAGMKYTSLVSIQSPRRTRILSEEHGVIVKMVMNLKMTQLVS